MSTEIVRQFLLAVSSDSALQEKLAVATDTQNVVGMASECGYSFTAQELKAVLTEANERELSDNELDAVAGGGGRWPPDLYTAASSSKGGGLEESLLIQGLLTNSLQIVQSTSGKAYK
jgi:predicted ribosomally synthesized peptide with nif11-like leader